MESDYTNDLEDDLEKINNDSNARQKEEILCMRVLIYQ